MRLAIESLFVFEDVHIILIYNFSYLIIYWGYTELLKDNSNFNFLWLFHLSVSTCCILVTQWFKMSQIKSCKKKLAQETKWNQ